MWLVVIELGNLASIATGPRYCVIVSRRWGSCEQVAVACETFEDTCLRRQVRLSSLKTRKTSPHRVDVRRPFCSTCQLQQAFACHGTIPHRADAVMHTKPSCGRSFITLSHLLETEMCALLLTPNPDVILL